MKLIQPIVDEHHKTMVKGTPQLNYCDPAVMVITQPLTSVLLYILVMVTCTPLWNGVFVKRLAISISFNVKLNLLHHDNFVKMYVLVARHEGVCYAVHYMCSQMYMMYIELQVSSRSLSVSLLRTGLLQDVRSWTSVYLFLLTTRLYATGPTDTLILFLYLSLQSLLL